MPFRGEDIHPAEAFRGTDIEEKLDVGYFTHITNETVARKALDFLLQPGHISSLIDLGHSSDEISMMWRAAYRGCIQFNVPIPTSRVGHARALGVIVE